jgi:glycosyltransferase involved in cell wall biosynthesis
MSDRERPLAVKMVAYGEQFAGAERQLLTLCTGLVRRGIDVQVHLRFDRDLASRLRTAGLTVDATETRSLGALARQLADPTDARSASIIHAHNIRSSMAAAAAHAYGGVPVVKTEHGSPWATGGSASVRYKTVLARFIETTALRTADATIVFVSRDLQRAAGWAQALRQEVIPNGVDLPAQRSPRPPELETDAFNVVFAGRLETVKGPLTALAAIASLPHQSRIRLTMLGEGPLRPDVDAALRDPALRDRARILGFREDALSFIEHADALVMPSLHEGLPFAALEALAYGTPLVASGVGGLLEVLSHDETALLVPPGDASAVAEALLRLESSPMLAARLRSAGEVLVRERLSADAMVDAYVGVYERTLEALNRSCR